MAYTDAFTDSDLTLLPAHDANWVKATTGTQVMQIESNQARGGSGGTLSLYLYNQTFADKHYAKATWNDSTATGIGVAIRVTNDGAGGDGFYCLMVRGDLAYNGECVNGGATDWDSGLALPTTGSVIELTIDTTTSTTVHYKVNTSVIQTYTDKTNVSGGRGGVCSYADGRYIDDWEGGDVGGAEAEVLSVSLAEPIIGGAVF